MAIRLGIQRAVVIAESYGEANEGREFEILDPARPIKLPVARN